MDVFERTLYNGFLAGVSFEGNTFFYPNPLEADGVHTFNQGVCGRSPWFNCSCCPVNVVRVLPSLPGYIYATDGQDVYVNLYIGSEAEFSLGSNNLKISQQTNYPWDGKVVLTVESEDKIEANVKLRVPGWARNEVMDGDLYEYIDQEMPSVGITLNGEPIKLATENGYYSLGLREWRRGDQIELSFDMPVRKVKSHDQVAANKGKFALERGPLVYCVEQVDNPMGVLSLAVSSNEDFQYQYDKSLFSGLGTIKGTGTHGTHVVELTAIPYYAWAHRKMGEMAVWLAAK